MKCQLLILLLLPSILLGQKRIHIQLYAGTNIGGPVGKVDGKGTPLPGIDLATTLSYKLSKKSSVSLGIRYVYATVKYSQVAQGDSTVYVTVGSSQVPVNTNFASNISGHLKLHYLMFPLQYNLKLGKHASAEVGAYLSYLLAGSDKGRNEVVFVENGLFNRTVEYNNYNDLQKLDYGITVGANYHFSKHFLFKLWALRGFRPLYKPGFFSSRGVTEAGLYNTSLHISLGYNFGSNE